MIENPDERWQFFTPRAIEPREKPYILDAETGFIKCPEANYGTEAAAVVVDGGVVIESQKAEVITTILDDLHRASVGDDGDFARWVRLEFIPQARRGV